MAGAYVSGANTADGGSYAPAAGTDTILGWMAFGYGSGGATASAQTFNAISMTEEQDLLNNLSGGGDPFGMLAHLVNPGTTSQVLDVTWSSTPSGEDGFAFTLSGIDQTTPIYPTNGNVSAAFTSDATPSLTYDAPADSVIIYWIVNRQNATPQTITAPTGFSDASGVISVITSPADISAKVFYKNQATLVTSATTDVGIGATNTGGVHGVLVFQSASGAFTLTGDSGSYTYTGTANAITADRLLAAVSGSYAYTGTALDLNLGRTLALDAGAYTYTGTALDLTFTGVGAFTLTADSGAYAYSGTANAIIADRVITGESGAYVYSGTAIGLNLGLVLSLDSGSYTYTGTALAFSKNSVLSAITGSYIYSGTSIVLTASGQIWTKQSDSVTSWSAQAGETTTWTPTVDETTTWTIQ